MCLVDQDALRAAEFAQVGFLAQRVTERDLLVPASTVRGSLIEVGIA